MQFRDLKIGDQFRFDSEWQLELQYSGIARGPWIKLSARCYHHAYPNHSLRQENDTHCRVGTINVDVRKEEAMDPTATLRELLDEFYVTNDERDEDRCQELCEALTDWMEMGGFTPDFSKLRPDQLRIVTLYATQHMRSMTEIE